MATSEALDVVSKVHEPPMFVKIFFKILSFSISISKSKKLLGCGIIAYNSDEIDIIAGKQSKNIERLLGYKGRAEAIHRDDMIVD